MTNKKLEKRKKRVRSRIRGITERPRLSVFRSNKQIYAQIIDDTLGKTLVSFSSKNLPKAKVSKMSKQEIAALVGEELAKAAKSLKISRAVFDRGGYRYHGRVKQVAEGARKGGLEI